MQDINAQGALEASQCLDELIKKVNSELTGACMIPIKLPKEESIRIIEQSKEWFYKNYEDALQENYYVIDKSFLNTPSFKNNRIIYLPGPNPDGSGRIFSVNKLAIMGEQTVGLFSRLGFLDSDFALQRFILSIGPGISYTSVQADNLMYYIVSESYYDMVRQIFIDKIAFNYNRLTRQLKILGETPNNHIILKVYVTISDCALFADEIFYRYVLAYHKKVIGTTLSMFDYNLPGNIKLNADAIKEMGQNELDAIKEEIKGDEGVDYFFTT